MKTCCFCQRPADSKEHIWSNWILKLLPDAQDGVFTKRFADGTSKSWHKKKPELKAGVVCERACNNGWMSTRLEQPMKAATEDIILNNKQKTFFPEDCAVIAAWAFKTTVLANHIELKGEPYFPVNQRHAFAHHLTIPPGTQVWIGRRNAGHLTANWRSIHRIQQPPTPLNPHLVKVPVSPYRFEHYTCTFTIGYLLLQVVTARWTERKVRERLDFPPILQAEVIDDYAIPIWPKRVSFGWPPPAAVGNAMFDRFWDRFDTINLPGWMR